jgi:hypothetical protein
MVAVMATDTTPAGGFLPTGTYDIPKLGKVKKVYVIGGAAVVVLAGVLWWRSRQAAKAPASELQTDSAGNVGIINPATGFVQGSPEDLAAQGGGTGGGSGGGGGGSSGSDQTPIGDQVAAGPPFTNNAAWAQYATAYLVGLGLDPGAVSADLGAYLAGEQVTPAVKSVIEQATGYAGAPPVAGQNGMPPSINLIGDPTSLGSTPGPVSITLGKMTPTSVAFAWTAVTGATGYHWHVAGPGVSHGGDTTAKSATCPGLQPGTAYTVSVYAKNAKGNGADTAVRVRTPAAASTPKPAAPAYAAVVVKEYTTQNPPWESTISGIAAHYGYGSDWQTVWNDPKNANLQALRHQPSGIRKGDVVYVKEK